MAITKATALADFGSGIGTDQLVALTIPTIVFGDLLQKKLPKLILALSIGRRLSKLFKRMEALKMFLASLSRRAFSTTASCPTY